MPRPVQDSGSVIRETGRWSGGKYAMQSAERGTVLMLSIQPALSATSTPPRARSGLDQSLLRGSVCDGGVGTNGHEPSTRWRQMNASVDHHPDAL